MGDDESSCRRGHTRWPRDWSSDVCSSDLTYIETDVQATADGVALVLHDADLSRVAGRQVQVGELTAADVRAISLSGGESIPTLGELLEELDRKSGVEGKRGDGGRRELVQKRAYEMAT